MYGYSGQNQYGGYNSTYTTSPGTAVYSAVQPQQNAQTQQLGANPLNIASATPSNVYAASFSSGSTTSPYTTYQASPNAAAAYAQFGQTAAAVAAVQQQQAASGVVSAPSGYNHSTRLSDSFATLPSAGTYSSLTDYTNSLRSAAAVVNSGTNSYVGVTRLGSGSSNGANIPSVTSSITTNTAGYDAAVYAAATSYLHSKASGSASVWMTPPKKTSAPAYSTSNAFGAGGSSSSASANVGAVTSIISRGQSTNKGRGTFPTKRFGGQSKPSGDVQQFYCEVCKISCAGSQTYKEHVDGQKHKKKEALQKGEGQTLSKSRVSFRCETCNVTCTGKDTYESHVRGSKHQKTANLMKKLGKPVQAEPTVLAPGEKSNSSTGTCNGAPITTVGGPAVPTKRVVAPSSINFVGGQKLHTTAQDSSKKVLATAEAALEAAGQKNAAVEAALAAEKDVQPVGEEYVEEERNTTGKLLQYICKLCDCKFSDPNAKNIHIKGRKHRLQYKMKVNPDLVVEMKPNQIPREMRNEFSRKYRAQQPIPLIPRPYGPPQPLMLFAPRPWPNLPDPGRRAETNEDRHVMAKHKLIYPSEVQLSNIEKLVIMVEKALKSVSDYFSDQDNKEKEDKTTNSKDDFSADGRNDRLLKGVMRVGLLAKGLLLKNDREVQLVVLCSKIPTHAVLAQVCKLLPQYLEKGDNEVVTVMQKPEESALFVKQSESDVICRVVLTSVLLREEKDSAANAGKASLCSAEKENATITDVSTPVEKTAPPNDALPTGPCLEALAELRHAKWFQVRCANLQSASITLRILRDIRQRVEIWHPLSSWASELLVEKVLASCGAPLSPGDAVRRVFEAISAGVLYLCGPGLADPCEKDSPDVLSGPTGQQREDITASSQHALRLIAFNQIFKVLAIDRIEDPKPFNTASGDRKRPRESNGSLDDGEVIDVKKDKKEEAKGEEKETA